MPVNSFEIHKNGHVFVVDYDLSDRMVIVTEKTENLTVVVGNLATYDGFHQLVSIIEGSVKLDNKTIVPKYPDAVVELSGQIQENAIAIVVKVRLALMNNGVSSDETDACLNDMMSSDYAHLMKVVEEWVTIQYV